jgi:hypothetical protein
MEAKKIEGNAKVLTDAAIAKVTEVVDTFGAATKQGGHRLQEATEKVMHAVEEVASKVAHTGEEAAQRVLDGAREAASKAEHHTQECAAKAEAKPGPAPLPHRKGG